MDEGAEEPWACSSAPERRKGELCTGLPAGPSIGREQRLPWSQQGGGCGAAAGEGLGTPGSSGRGVNPWRGILAAECPACLS